MISAATAASGVSSAVSRRRASHRVAATAAFTTSSRQHASLGCVMGVGCEMGVNCEAVCGVRVAEWPPPQC